jgi:hypothetical protein
MGHEKIHPGPTERFVLSAIANSQTNLQLNRPFGNSSSPISAEVAFPCTVLALVISAAVARSAGSAVFTLWKNGNTTSPVRQIALDNNPLTIRGFVTFTAGEVTMAPGDRYDIRVVTSADWAPIPPTNIFVEVGVIMGYQ